MTKLKSLNEFREGGFSLNSRELGNVSGGLADTGGASVQTQYGEATCVNNTDDRMTRKRKDGPDTGGVWGDWSLWYSGPA